MANSSPSDIITTPKGGGALQGLGEKFSPDLHTGTGNFTVPIALPPGRNGFSPKPNLAYSTGNGNSAFGLGWSLSVPGVSRKTSKSVPLLTRTADPFGKLIEYTYARDANQTDCYRMMRQVQAVHSRLGT
jgi:hypothetical protein